MLLARCQYGTTGNRGVPPAPFSKARNLCIRLTYGVRGYNKNQDNFFQLFNKINPGPLGISYTKNPHAPY